MTDTGNASRSEALFARAQICIPGGVNSPVRAFRSVGGTPRFIARGQGPYIWDADGRRYVDLVGSWGPMIVGHAHPAVLEAVNRAARDGLSFGAPTEAEVEFAERLVRMLPSMEQVRLVSSGTEATMSAIRLARGATGRSKLIKFEGCYHGHADALLVKAGSGALTFGNPSSAGVPPETAQHTIVLDYNDCQQLEDAFERMGAQIACVIVEPIAGNMNLVRASAEFLQTMRRQCSGHGAVLIFDEVMTGFRVALGGAQSLYGIVPDLTTLGKVIGGGMPLAAFGGRRDIMAQLAPLGPVYQAGTLSGNPVAVACGRATLELVEQPGFYETLGKRTRSLAEALVAPGQDSRQPFSADAVGSMFGLYSASQVPRSFAQVMSCDKERFNRFFHAMLDRGVYLAPSAYEAGFVSIQHDEAVVAQVAQAAREAFATLAP
ncbi:glutamate-1-semialdehyde aminotransferase (aminomutase) [Burkholderiales bacterium]|nr:glutamate-1-semialdehyde aminotransferase (aminomutase) [Burkholderiales bacterium]